MIWLGWSSRSAGCRTPTGPERIAADADREFHDGIVAAARNPLLATLWEQLSSPVDKTRRASLARPGRPAASLRAHRRIRDAITAADPDRAAKAMLAHLEVVADLGFLTTLRDADRTIKRT